MHSCTVVILGIFVTVFSSYPHQVLVRAQCRPTSEATEGPFFVEGAPERSELLCSNSEANDRLFLQGRILTDDCKTGLAATIDVWQADSNGNYSTPRKGSRSFSYFCRARLETDRNGYYKLSTIMPGRYVQATGFRPAHVHFTIHPHTNDYQSLTTQLYFNHDMFLGDHDSCGPEVCHSDDPTLIITLNNDKDLKTYNGTWNVVLRRA